MIARLLISPSLNKRVEEIKKILISQGIQNNHPDLLYFPFDAKLGIEQAREIKKHFSLKPYSAKGKIVVLEDASTLTLDAQNALLKTLEEPPSEAILILSASTENKFLPTILSRCQISYLNNKEEEQKSNTYIIYKEDMDRLIEAGYQERFEYIEKIKEKDEFLSFLVTYFREKMTNHYTTSLQNTQNKALNEFLMHILKAEEWNAQNVNTRAILEFLMLVMPNKL